MNALNLQNEHLPNNLRRMNCNSVKLSIYTLLRIGLGLKYVLEFVIEVTNSVDN